MIYKNAYKFSYFHVGKCRVWKTSGPFVIDKSTAKKWYYAQSCKNPGIIELAILAR